ncbi:MAG: formylglycine-generating enzyme family protein [Candidatus Riflebacteria bacterium]|nr:formylglycine-generating enzyme family protein [Candidatus Riflebacteria bacterium]
MNNFRNLFLLIICTAFIIFPIHTAKASKEYVKISDDIFIEMTRVPAGTFESPQIHSPSTSPWDKIRITHDFYISTYEITQEQWLAVMKNRWPIQKYLSPNNIYAPTYWVGEEPHKFSPQMMGIGDKFPIYFIKFDEAADFCNMLSKHMGLKPCYSWNEYTDELEWDTEADGFRLPTIAEWEYAAGGGKTCRTKYYWGDEMDSRYAVEADYGDIPSTTVYMEVGQKLPNSLGLYDMVGNALEWCWDPGSKARGEVIKNGVYMDPQGDTNQEYVSVRAPLGEIEYGIHQSKCEFQYPNLKRRWQYGFRIVRTVK